MIQLKENTYMIQWQYEERPASSNFCDDGNKLGVDGTKIGVMCIPCYLNVVIATLPFERNAVHMAEFRAPHATKPYLKIIYTCEYFLRLDN